MKIVVIGGTGLIGSKTVAILRRAGQEVVAASPKGGVNTVTGEGLEEAMAGAQVVIDLSNAPSFDAKAVLARTNFRPFIEQRGTERTALRKAANSTTLFRRRILQTSIVDRHHAIDGLPSIGQHDWKRVEAGGGSFASCGFVTSRQCPWFV
jgi:uncharacterized protein YbjT (DUF2867 family)